MSVIRILHLEDDPGFSRLVESMLESLGPESALTRVEGRQEFETALATGLFHLVLADHSLPAYDGLQALDHVRRHHRQVPFVFLSGVMGEELAVVSLQNGAADYVLKTNLSRLVPTVIRTVQKSEEARGLKEAQDRILADRANLRALVEYTSDAIWSLDRDLRVVAFNSAASLLAMKLGGPPLSAGGDFLGTLPDQARSWWRIVAEKVLGGQRVIEEHVLTWKGNRCRLEVSLAPIMADSKPRGIAVSCRDLAHR